MLTSEPRLVQVVLQRHRSTVRAMVVDSTRVAAYIGPWRTDDRRAEIDAERWLTKINRNPEAITNGVVYVRVG